MKKTVVYLLIGIFMTSFYWCCPVPRPIVDLIETICGFNVVLCVIAIITPWLAVMGILARLFVREGDREGV